MFEKERGRLSLVAISKRNATVAFIPWVVGFFFDRGGARWRVGWGEEKLAARQIDKKSDSTEID